MNKKRIFAIVVFIILGLFMYTFANPLNDESNDNNANQPATSADTNDKKEESRLLADNNTRNTRRQDTRRVVNTNTQQVATDATPVEQPVVTPVEEPTPVAPVVDPATNVDPIRPVQPVEPVKPAIEDKPINLTIDKINAVDELKKHKGNYEFSDDTDYNKVIEDYSKKINDSTTKDEINSNLSDGKDAIDKLIAEDLFAYKEAAKKEISDYADELDIKSDIKEVLVGFNNDIDEATTKKEIDKIVVDAKAKLDEIKAAEIKAAQDAAKKAIEDQNKEDETNLPKIVDIKNEGKDAVDKAETIEDIEKIKEDTIEAIKDIINNKEYTVVFYGLMNKKLSTQTVKYKKAATAPKMNATQKGWNNSIEVEFLGWDTEADTLNAVTSDLEVRAQFKVLSATTKISILKEGLKNKDGSEKTISTDVKDFNHPYNRPEVEKDIYFNLNVNEEIEKAVNNYRGSHIFVYTDDNDTIRNVVEGEPSVYNNNKYKELQYYVLKLQGDRFHCDARVIYNHAAELADAKTAAINEITDYKTVETEDIDEIKTTKTEAINAIKDMTSVEDVKNKVQPTKDAIDTIIKNKTYDVTFVGKTTSKTVKVGYNKNAVAPTTKEFTNPVYRNVTYRLTGWDNSLENIKANTTITASYEIEKVVATVFLIGEKYNIPSDRNKDLEWKAYTKYKTVELKVTDKIKEAIKNDKKALVFDTDAAIRAVLKDSNSLPIKDGKYKTYEFYAMKFIEDSLAGFHIDGKMFYDKDAEALDNAKEELRGLIREAEAKSTKGKTDASIKELKDDIKTAKEEVVEGNDINAINDSITELKKDKLVDIKVTSVTVVDKKKNHTYIEGQSFELEVSYSDNNGVKDKVIKSGYTVSKDTNTVGKNQKATVTYEKVTSNEFTFTVVAKEISSIKVESAKYEYFLNEEADLTVTATYNDGTSRVLNSNEYKLTGFVNHETTYKGKKNHPKTAKVHLISKGSIQDTFEYSISTYTKDGYNKKLINDIDISLSHPWFTDEYYINFSNHDSKVKILSVSQNGKTFVKLNPTQTTNKYSLKEDDYWVLRDNNTFFDGDYVQIEYEAHGIKYVAYYSEAIGDLTLRKLV